MPTYLMFFVSLILCTATGSTKFLLDILHETSFGLDNS